MRVGSLGSRPSSMSSVLSNGQWSAMVLGAPHRPWCLPHPSGPSPGQTHRGSLASTRARARRWAFEVYGLRPRERRLSLAFLHSSHREPEETRRGQPEVEHTLYIAPPSEVSGMSGYPHLESSPADHSQIRHSQAHQVDHPMDAALTCPGGRFRLWTMPDMDNHKRFGLESNQRPAGRHISSTGNQGKETMTG